MQWPTVVPQKKARLPQQAGGFRNCLRLHRTCQGVAAVHRHGRAHGLFFGPSDQHALPPGFPMDVADERGEHVGRQTFVETAPLHARARMTGKEGLVGTLCRTLRLHRQERHHRMKMLILKEHLHQSQVLVHFVRLCEGNRMMLHQFGKPLVGIPKPRTECRTAHELEQ